MTSFFLEAGGQLTYDDVVSHYGGASRVRRMEKQDEIAVGTKSHFRNPSKLSQTTRATHIVRVWVCLFCARRNPFWNALDHTYPVQLSSYGPNLLDAGPPRSSLVPLHPTPHPHPNPEVEAFINVLPTLNHPGPVNCLLLISFVHLGVFLGLALWYLQTKPCLRK